MKKIQCKFISLFVLRPDYRDGSIWFYILIHYFRPCVRRVEGRGYRGPPWCATGTEVPRARKKMRKRAADRRANTKKAGKKYFGGSEGAGEKKKYYLGGSKKNSGVNEDTTHKKAYVP